MIEYGKELDRMERTISKEYRHVSPCVAAMGRMAALKKEAEAIKVFAKKVEEDYTVYDMEFNKK